MHTVRSSNLRAIGYEPTTATLGITFTSGDTYHYAGVPRPTYDALRIAPSHGQYFAQHIRPYFRGVKQVKGRA